jgi:hypothetical protein
MHLSVSLNFTPSLALLCKNSTEPKWNELFFNAAERYLPVRDLSACKKDKSFQSLGLNCHTKIYAMRTIAGTGLELSTGFNKSKSLKMSTRLENTNTFNSDIQKQNVEQRELMNTE